MNPIELIAPFIATLWVFILIFLVCESGTMVANQFDMFDEKFRECKWYLLPNDMQRMLVIFISDLQQPKFIRGYANVVCTREAFKKVRLDYVKYFI